MIPEKSVTNDPFSSKSKYLEKLNQKKEVSVDKDSIISNYDEEISNYNPDWADEF